MDTIIPIYINQAMPDLFIVVFMLTLLAAAMSTLSSLFHAMGSALHLRRLEPRACVRPLGAGEPGRVHGHRWSRRSGSRS